MLENTAVNDYRKQPNAGAAELKHLPGDYGLPIMGDVPALFKDFFGTLTKRYEKYGPVSRFNMAIQRGVMLLDPDLTKEIMLDTGRNFSNKMGYKDSAGEWFGDAILLRDFDEHRLHRRVFQAAFKSDAMRGYVEAINEIVAQHLNNWENQKDLRFVNAIQALLMNVGARVFYGVTDLGEEADKMGEAFLQIIYKGMGSVVKINLPPFGYYYGQKGKKYIKNYIGSLISSRRAKDGKDFMSYLVKEKMDNGEYLTDDELVDHLAFLFFAAYDTTTTALSHAVMHLAMDQPLQEKLRAHSQSVGKVNLAYDELDQLGDIENVFYEALRLYPSVSFICRRTIKECELGGQRIPANTIVFAPPMFNQRSEKWWTNAQKFDPDRFSKEREEQKRHSHIYTPFGGGAHKCIGMNFAAMNAKLFLHQFLLKYRFRLPADYVPKSKTLPLPTPVGRLPVILEKL